MSSLRTFSCNNQTYAFYSLPDTSNTIEALPYSQRILLENLIRNEAPDTHIKAASSPTEAAGTEISYAPARVLMQDFTGVPAIADLAAMRDAVSKPENINPLIPVDLVIDHSVMIDRFGTPDALAYNIAREYERNRERYAFLRWGAQAFRNLQVVPPGAGICHQVNLERLATVVATRETDHEHPLLIPDTVVGTDSHTTMINGLGVLGWGVGGIEAEAAMLGQPISMLIPEVVGFQLEGRLREGACATDMVLTITEILRGEGVVGKFVEFCGTGLDTLPVEDRATIANMAPEYGATCGFFPVDAATISYLRATGRPDSLCNLVETYARAQNMWRETTSPIPTYARLLKLNLNDVEPSLAGPRRPQDRIPLTQVAPSFQKDLADTPNPDTRYDAANYTLGHGDVVIAAITSCTNTSNPSVMVGAGLVARNARAKGLNVKPWVKTSLAPGSQVVHDYLARANLIDDLEALGFHIAGYGCTTCIGNSGPLPETVEKTLRANDLIGCAVLSGNRNFEGRISPDVRANYLASPMLVVAYALAGSVRINLTTEPLGTDAEGNPVYLKDIWPTNQEIADLVRSSLEPAMFDKRYQTFTEGDEQWRALPSGEGTRYRWEEASTYVRRPTFLDPQQKARTKPARVLALLGDSITTDHISPAGSIRADSPAGLYLQEHGVDPLAFNSYGARRGNHEVMMRGTFANVRLRNLMTPDKEGGFTRHHPSGDATTIYDAAMRYQEEGVPLAVFAGAEYGTGSSRDWAAKGVLLLGVRYVVARSFERIHRSNLVGMGVLPLECPDGWDGLDGSEEIFFTGIEGALTPRQDVMVRAVKPDGSEQTLRTVCRIDTAHEVHTFNAGGVLPHVLKILNAA